MSRVLRVGWLILSAVVLCSRPADAALADWLEKLSGPGPFEEDALANLVSTWCFTKTLTQPDDRPTPCLYVDYHRMINEKDDNFYQDVGLKGKELKLTAYAFGLAFQPWRDVPIDVGGEIGRLQFLTKDTDTTKWTLAPRVQVKPLLFVPKLFARGEHPVLRKGASVLKFYVRRLVILGTLNGERDFGVPGSTFEIKNERRWSLGFLLDFTELRRP
jgi:hypothetical protein